MYGIYPSILHNVTLFQSYFPLEILRARATTSGIVATLAWHQRYSHRWESCNSKAQSCLLLITGGFILGRKQRQKTLRAILDISYTLSSLRQTESNNKTKNRQYTFSLPKHKYYCLSELLLKAQKNTRTHYSHNGL